MLSPEEQRRLMQLAREGAPGERRQAIAVLIADFRGPAMAAICKTLLSCGESRMHAEDVFQTACVKFIAKGIDQYTGINAAAPRTYFARIAVRCAIDFVRRRQVEKSGLDPDALGHIPLPPGSSGSSAQSAAEDQRSETPTVEAPVIAIPEKPTRPDRLKKLLEKVLDAVAGDPGSRERAREAIVACWQALRDPYRRAIALYCLEEAGDHATCAAIMGVSKDAFMQHVSRGRLMLARSLAERLVGAELELEESARRA